MHRLPAPPSGPDVLLFSNFSEGREGESGCFGDFVREAVKPHTSTNRPRNYGNLTWVQDDTSWAIGHGGQRIGWNRRNDRMLVLFSSVEDYMPDLHRFYSAWSKLP
jgi:hypothetical protein